MANPPTSLIKPIFAVKHSLDKGYHLVATRDIKAGTLVLDEKPLIVLSQSFQNDNAWLVHTRIEMLLQKMNEKNVMDFHILYCSPDADTDTIHHNRFYKNCFNLENQFDGPEVPREDGCFKYASRINHACSPNTEATYYRALGRQKVYALKDIAAGDDFTVSYTNVLASRQSRQEDLETRYGFQCCCEACSLDTEESTDRDRRLQIVQRTLESVHSS
ncbi:SET domain-containing protein, partial [Ascobolus immersus RN42]